MNIFKFRFIDNNLIKNLLLTAASQQKNSITRFADKNVAASKASQSVSRAFSIIRQDTKFEWYKMRFAWSQLGTLEPTQSLSADGPDKH